MKITEKEIKQLKEYVIKRFKSCDKDYQNYDLKAKLDTELSFAENKSLFDEELKVVCPLPPTKADIEEQKAREQEKEVLIIQELQAQEFEKIRNSPTADILEHHFSVIKELTKALIKAKYKKGCWFYGNGGMGKTINTLKALAELGLEENKDFILVAGVKSLLSFIKLLERNFDKIIVVDDDSISKNRDVANILKQALVGGYIQYESERTKINKKFEGKIILISNDTTENSDIDAVKTRCFTYNFTLTYKQIIDCLYSFANLDKKFPELSVEKKREMVDYIKEITSDSTRGLTLRAFDDGCELIIHHKDKWKELLSKLLYPKPEYYLIIQGVEIKDVSIQTGLSKSRLYEIKHELGLTKLGRNQYG